MYAHRIARPPRPRVVRPAKAQIARAPGGAQATTLTDLQRSAGNRAVTAFIQRDTDPKETARIAALETSYHNNVTSGSWAHAAMDLNGFDDAGIVEKVAALSHDQLIALDAGARHAMPGWDSRVTKPLTDHDAEADRVGKLTFHYEEAVAKHDFEEASVHLNAFNEHDILAKANRLTKDELKKMMAAAADTKVGNGRLSKVLDTVAGGSSERDVDEQVGGTIYGAHGSYRYHMSADALVVNVGMNFHPKKNVVVPTATWFGYITSAWNRFSAVNDADPTDKKHIDFQPIAGEGHDIDVAKGSGRANAGLYYESDTRASDAVPHEFGHLLGFADEYERDAADYAAVTGGAPTIGSGKAAPALPSGATPETIAKGIHDGLFVKEKVLQWHKTAKRNRMKAVDAVLVAAGIATDYQRGENPLTAQVSEAYKRVYSHEMSVDFMKQVDGDDDEFYKWREQTLGSFQYTSSSLMGDMSDHTHPIAARHVREYVGYVQRGLGRGTWTPKEER